MDVIPRLYTTYMRFGSDEAQTAKIKWVWCQPDARPLGLPSPFVSRNWDQWEIWPSLGEVQGASRVYSNSEEVSTASGQEQPCGNPAVWLNGYPGTVPPDYPRNMFGISACCGTLLDFLGQPTLGLAPWADGGDYFGGDYFGDDYFGGDYWG